MNYLLPYCGLANVRINASDKDLPVRYNQPSRIFLPKKKYILNPLNRGPQEFEFCIFDAFSCDHTSSAGQHGCLVKRSKFMFPMQLERHVRIHPWVMMYTNFLHNMTRHWSICFLLPTNNSTCPQLKSNKKQIQTLEQISSFVAFQTSIFFLPICSLL